MIDQQFKYQETSKLIALAGGLYFLAYLIFSLVLLRERFMVDGAYMIYEITNYQNFPGAQNRYIILLLDFLPVLFAKMEIPLRAVMVSWVVNYVLFYAICFYMVLLVFKDRKGAWIILFMNLFVMASCFFNIADEIIPSATLAVLANSYWSSRKDRRSGKALIIMIVLMFFVVFGHLLVSFGLAMVAAFYYLISDSKKELAVEYYKPVLVFSIFLFFRIKFGMQDSYESENMTLSGSSLFIELASINGRFIIDFIKFYIQTFYVIGVMGLLALAYYLKNRNWKAIAYFSLLAILFVIVWRISIHSRLGDVFLSSRDNVMIRWLFPLNFLILFSFFSTSVLSSLRYSRAIHALFIIVTVFQFSLLYHLSDFASNTVDQYVTMIGMTEEEQGWKFYTDFNGKCQSGNYHDVYTNALVFSAMEGPESTRQFIFAHQDEIASITGLGEDSLYIARFVKIPLSELNPVYYRNEPAPYRKLEVDFRDCSFE
ncbi:MAG: hypothetical protein GY751_07030 [Bacteroidetes bacterium]|nr:hypothetical protein [Bacteroidota bacterium]